MRKLLKFSLLPIIATTMSAATINLNTGTAQWQVTQTSGATANSAAGIGTVGSAATGNAVVLTGQLPFASNLPGFEAFAWANPFGGAAWIGQLITDGQFSNPPTITCGNPCGAVAGNYTYTLSFSAALGGSMILSGFTGDNGVRALTVSQTGGADLYSCTVGGPGTLCAGTQNAVTASTGTLNWTAAAGRMITITAIVENLDGPGRNPSGFILAGSATTVDPANGVPEPSTYAMLGLGGAAMLFARLRRK
jgi:hypothetical protein